MINFPVAKARHAMWVLKLSNFVGGASDVASLELVSHHDCNLGKWLYGEGRQQYGHLAEFRALERDHRELHMIGLQIVELKHQSRIGEAQAELAKIAPLSQAILKHLDWLEKETPKAGKH